MKRLLLFLICLVGITSVKGQNLIIKKEFRASNSYYILKAPRDTTLYVSYIFSKGKLAEVRIDCVNTDGNAEYSYFMCGGNNIRNFINLRNHLIDIRTKFEEWTKTAIDNKVKSFYKNFADYKDVNFHRIVGVRGKGAYTSMFGGINQPYINLSPTFSVVEKEGKITTSLFIGIMTSSNVFKYKSPDGYAPSLWSMVITEANDGTKDIYKFHEQGLRFFSYDELQTLIDALDFNRVKELYNKEINKEKEYDNLFK